MNKRKKTEEPHVNLERWLITYSDLITLLMIFFVIMFAMSTINKQKYQQLQVSLSNAMHQNVVQLPKTGSSGLISSSNMMNQEQVTPAQEKQYQADNRRLSDLYQELNKYVAEKHLQNEVTVTNQIRGVQVTMRDVALFDTGSAELRSDAQKLIKGFVPFIQSVPNDVVIEGYTDNRPINTPQFKSNWELSSMRAINVVHYLINNGVNPPRLSGVGYGPYHFVATNSTRAGRQQNRRVNMVFMRMSDTSQMTQQVMKTLNKLGTKSTKQ